VKDVGDLYFHLEAPAENSWVAVGTGSQMKGSLMLVVYRSEDEKGITLSPRIVNGNVEPSYDDQTNCQLNNVYAVNGYCKDINHKSHTKQRRYNGSIKREEHNDGDNVVSFDNLQQPFIFALGPTDRHLHDDRKDADIRRHSMYGHFNIDLTKSTVERSEDVAQDELSAIGTWENYNAQIVGGTTKDRDWSGNLHSLIMCGVFVILFPIGVVFLRLLEMVKWHAWMQGIGAACALCGVGLGIWAGLEYNHSKRFNSPHQLVGFAVVGATLVQLALGFTHHLLYKKHHRPTILGYMHRFFGPLIMLAGVANGFLGFKFSGGIYHNLMYGIIVGVFFTGLVGALFWAHKRRQTKRRVDERIADEAYEEFKGENRGPSSGQVWGGPHHGIEMREIPTEVPPSYEDEVRPVEPKTMV
ncbi:iron reductase domain protein, partial [Melanomma pulvis-pyrius CBS 109.77]